MKEFRGKIAVITGAGNGMGRELARQLAAEGCHLALADIMLGNLTETVTACREAAPAGTRITARECDVASEEQVMAWRDSVAREHGTAHINLLFNNAGIGGGGSFVADSREEWDRTFGICWGGVYNCSRAFLPMLVASTEGYIVNTSSVNGFWACLGPGIPHTAYSAAKFAVKGFTEALITDLRNNAPHVKAAVVMPGHIGTAIGINSRLVQGKGETMTTGEIADARRRMQRQNLPVENLSDDELRAMVRQRMEDFRDKAPTSAAQAATIILEGVRNDDWRILVGDDARRLDRLVRERPLDAYEPSFGAFIQEAAATASTGTR